MQCLDLRELPEFRMENSAKEAAVSLKEVLDRIELPHSKQIPDLKAMTNEDGSLKNLWIIPNTEIGIVLIKQGPYQDQFQFSADTVRKAPTFYKRVKDLPYKRGATENFAILYETSPGSQWLSNIVSSLPDSMNTRKRGLAIWQWCGIVTVLLLSAVIMAALYYTGRRVSGKGAKVGILRYLFGLIFSFIAIFVPIEAQSIIANQLVISGSTLYVLQFNLSLITLFAGMILILGIGRRAGEIIVTAPNIAAHSIDAQLIRIGSRMIGFLAAMVLLMQGGQHLGIPLTSLLAGAGVVGMALALSAQDVLKNVFGSIMLILDKPFTVGERIKVMKYDGIVEEIGLRSTKIRLLNGHQASIPNEEMAKIDIENVGRRPFIRRVSQLALPINTSSSNAAEAVSIVKKILDNHDCSNPELPPRVWLSDFERDNVCLKFMYWFHSIDYWRYAAHADETNRNILDAFNAAGITVALPSFTTKTVNIDPKE